MSLHYDGEIKITKLNLTGHETNCYVLACPASNRSIIIDAPGDVEQAQAAAAGTKVEAIWLTHNHIDHVHGLAEFRDAFRVPVYIHEADASKLDQAPERLLRDGEELLVGELRFRVIHAPGHTPGSLCFLSGKHLFAGDTLFPGGPGYTRTPQALTQIIASITGKLFTLPDETAVYPGHGPDATIGQAKAEYAVFVGRQHPPELCGDVLWLQS